MKPPVESNTRTRTGEPLAFSTSRVALGLNGLGMIDPTLALGARLWPSAEVHVSWASSLPAPQAKLGVDPVKASDAAAVASFAIIAPGSAFAKSGLARSNATAPATCGDAM